MKTASFRLLPVRCLPVVGFLLPVFFASCRKKEPPVPPHTRTVLVYLGRDNNLSDDFEEKIKYLLEGWKGEGNLVFYQDLPDTNPRLMVAEWDESGARAKVIREYEPENSADAGVFGRVLNETQTLYPADSYGMILFSHASGWLPPSTQLSPRSIVVDRNSEMELIDFAAAIPDGMFDFIIFEACFMAGIEVAYELKDKTKHILASSAEILSPGFAAIYRNSAHLLFQPAAALEDFAREWFLWMDTRSGAFRSATISLIRTDRLTDLKNHVKLAGEQQPDLSGIQYFDRNSPHLFFDFEDCYSRRLPAGKRRQELSALVRQAVTYRAATPTFMSGHNGFGIHRHSGLTTYIEQPAFPYLNSQYQRLKWKKEQE
ncbi:MAG: hypothetical protein LBR08_05015 [Bacteroidales bacterium]|jgi:hypothetical protein|nr:hypothetical protein [Bacteroidales bacterium]